jgi:hypothetical protein
MIMRTHFCALFLFSSFSSFSTSLSCFMVINCFYFTHYRHPNINFHSITINFICLLFIFAPHRHAKMLLLQLHRIIHLTCVVVSHVSCAKCEMWGKVYQGKCESWNWKITRWHNIFDTTLA